MKFKGFISSLGMRALERSVLPSLEKFGKQCYFLISPDELFLIQDSEQADGMETAARLHRDVVFESNTLECSSRNENNIAFRINIALFLKVLRAASAHDAQTLRVKLANRTVPGNVIGECGVQRPMLVFNFEGDNLALGNELPVGSPCDPAQLERILDLREVKALCTFYLDIAQELPVITGCVNTFKALSTSISVSLTYQGDLHLGIAGPGVSVGQGIPGLDVHPESILVNATRLQAQRVEARLLEAMAAGQAVSAVLSLPQWAKVLHSVPLSNPQRVLCGAFLPDGGDIAQYVHIMFVYEASGQQDDIDDSISLFYKIPIREN